MQIEPDDLFLDHRRAERFRPGGALAVADGDAVDACRQPARRAVRSCRADPGLAPGGPQLVRELASGRGAVLLDHDALWATDALWPDHCIQGTAGAALHRGLAADHAELVIRKGFRAAIDSYSAFFENDRQTPTGLAGYLRERGLKRVVMAGLATDFCVQYSALDARRLGFETTVVLISPCRARSILGGSLAGATAAMHEAGVALVRGECLRHCQTGAKIIVLTGPLFSIPSR